MSSFDNYGPIEDYDYKGPTRAVKTRYGTVQIPTEEHAIGIQRAPFGPMLQVYIPLQMVKANGTEKDPKSR